MTVSGTHWTSTRIERPTVAPASPLRAARQEVAVEARPELPPITTPRLVATGPTPLQRKDAARPILDRAVVGQARAKQAALDAIANVDAKATTLLELRGAPVGKSAMATAVTEALTSDADRRFRIRGEPLRNAKAVEDALNTAAWYNPNETTMLQDMRASLRRHEGPLVIQLEDVDKIAPEAWQALAKELAPLLMRGSADMTPDGEARPVVLMATGRDTSSVHEFMEQCESIVSDGASPRRSVARFTDPTHRDLKAIARRVFEARLGTRTVQIDGAMLDHLAKLAERVTDRAPTLTKVVNGLADEIIDNDLKSLSVAEPAQEACVREALERGMAWAFEEAGDSSDLGLKVGA